MKAPVRQEAKLSLG